MQDQKDQAQRFIDAFEKLYGRKPKQEDAEGHFAAQVAQDMQISVGGARQYIRAATKLMSKQTHPE